MTGKTRYNAPPKTAHSEIFFSLCFNLGMGAEYIYVTILMTSIVSGITVSTNLNSKVDNQHFCSSCFCIES